MECNYILNKVIVNAQNSKIYKLKPFGQNYRTFRLKCLFIDFGSFLSKIWPVILTMPTQHMALLLGI